MHTHLIFNSSLVTAILPLHKEASVNPDYLLPEASTDPLRRPLTSRETLFLTFGEKKSKRCDRQFLNFHNILKRNEFVLFLRRFWSGLVCEFPKWLQKQMPVLTPLRQWLQALINYTDKLEKVILKKQHYGFIKKNTHVCTYVLKIFPHAWRLY